MSLSVNDSKNSKKFMDELSINVILPILNRVFTIDKNLPNIPIFKTIMKEDMTGQILFKINVNIFKKGKIELTIIYNINQDISQPNTFIKLIIDKIQGNSEQSTFFIMEQIINLGNELPVTMIVINNVTLIKSKSRQYIDLLMILYTNQSVYSNMGFIQLTYPQLLTDIKLLLYTPMNELKIPEELTTSISNIFGISPTGNLNTLFFVMYPRYVNKTYTTQELNLANNLYLFLIGEFDNVKQYTQTTIYMSPHIPSPYDTSLSLPCKTSSKFNGNILKLLKPSQGSIEQYIINPKGHKKIV
jgi:hypothetical protein